MNLIVGLKGSEPSVVKNVISVHKIDDLIVFDYPDSNFEFGFYIKDLSYLEITND